MSTTASQRFPLNMSKSMKAEVTRLAKEDGVSVNAWINTAIAVRVGGETAAESFFQRLRDSSDPDTMMALLKKSQNG